MYGRVTTVRISPGETDRIADVFGSLLPLIRTLRGYHGSFVLVDDSSTRFLIVTLWSSAEDRAESEPTAVRLTRAETIARGWELESVGHYVVPFADSPGQMPSIVPDIADPS
jgi:hypothetical protein